MLFDQTPAQAAIETIRRALADELRDASTLTALAENLDAIARHYGIPTEHVVSWIRMPAPGKRWTAAEFKRFCELVDEERKRENADAELLLPTNFPE